IFAKFESLAEPFHNALRPRHEGPKYEMKNPTDQQRDRYQSVLKHGSVPWWHPGVQRSLPVQDQIGRASCRERVEMIEVGEAIDKKDINHGRRERRGIKQYDKNYNKKD